jgi:hypothetical protein
MSAPLQVRVSYPLETFGDQNILPGRSRYPSDGAARFDAVEGTLNRTSVNRVWYVLLPAIAAAGSFYVGHYNHGTVLAGTALFWLCWGAFAAIKQTRERVERMRHHTTEPAFVYTADSRCTPHCGPRQSRGRVSQYSSCQSDRVPH